MEGFPKEIIKYIGKFLRPEDQSAFRKTCHVYRKLFAGVFLNINRNRMYLYAQRAMCEKRHDAVDYFFGLLSKLKRDADDEGGCRKTFMRIIESDCVISMYCFKKYFLQETDSTLRMQLWASEPDSRIWDAMLCSVNTFQRLSDCFFYLMQNDQGWDFQKVFVVKKLIALFQFVTPKFLEWSFKNEHCPIALAIIDKLQFYIDFNCSARCSEQLQRLYCKFYIAGYSHGGFSDKENAHNLISFINATCCIYEHSCKALTHSNLHDMVADYCKCERTSIEFDIRKRLSEAEIENERVTKRIKF